MKEQEILKTTVLKLYNAGTKVKDIVTHTGVPRSTVYYWIKNCIPKETSPLNLRDYYFLKQKCEPQEKIIAILKTAPCTVTAALQERLAAIEQMVSVEYNVNTLCEALEVAKGTYYNHTLRNKRGETKSAHRSECLIWAHSTKMQLVKSRRRRVYHQFRRNCISSKRNALYIIIAKAKYSLRLMIYSL